MRSTKSNSRQEKRQGKLTARGDYSMESVMSIIKDAKGQPMSWSEAEVLDAELMAYGAERAKKAGIKERDVVRIIHESRALRRTS